ncbi:MAG: chlorite dismutase [Nitrosopumilaceae archaeon]|nr:chlorite dismutase family protein [Nitrosopumilaceae archaeon]NIU00739.1 chlorite dismutase family protein [Nitrosopumilaceae archaeon]NIU87171.1 chlorite dismutase [Nitrosopumilaceae archaeon]NIV65698.1 chlorite dismutase [Nitrosopumilaceae archaeon]NIX61341.1 chlorite dismutase [Nitrosopumilaceae archaeon]
MEERDDQKYFFVFSFFKVDPKWRWMADLAKEESAREVENVIKNSGIKFRSYSTLGMRADSDFLFWFAAKSVDEIQQVMSKIYLTVFGKYISSSLNYLSCTRPSIYAKKGRTISFVAGDEAKKYVVVYPFIKTREWYLLSRQERQKMMDEHINVSQKYPEIILNTTYSFGIDDQDFMLAFETEDLRNFQDLIMDLRETQVSRYVKADTPMITCIKKDIIPLISSLG